MNAEKDNFKRDAATLLTALLLHMKNRSSEHHNRPEYVRLLYAKQFIYPSADKQTLRLNPA